MNHCTDIPVSWLRLEQLAVGELASGEASSVRSHLDECAACRSSLDSIEGDHRALPPLALPLDGDDAADRGAGWARLRAWLAGGGVLALAAAALVFFVLRGGDATPGSPVGAGNRVAIKGGGELVMSLVRMRGAVQSSAPLDFIDGDRFKVALTCSEAGPVAVDVVVIQGGELFRPLGADLEIRCGNNVSIPGAFAPTGVEPVTVCIAPRANRAEPLAANSLDGAACQSLGSPSSP